MGAEAQGSELDRVPYGGLIPPGGLECISNSLLHATMLQLLGVDHTQLTYRFSGRDMRLTDVHGKVIHDIRA